MNLLKTVIISLTAFLFCTVTSGQTNENIFQNYLDEVKSISCDSSYRKVTNRNNDYSSWLTGYSKDDSIYLIIESYEQEYGRQECTFLFHSGDLVFVNKRQINTKQLVGFNTYSDTSTYVKFEGFYQLSDGNIIASEVTGEENEREMFELYTPCPYKSNSAEYFLFISKLDKRALLKRKAANKYLLP